MRVRTTDALRARIATNLAIKNRPEFTNIHIVRKVADLHPRIEPFITTFLSWAVI